jgi:hypothetical protein
MPAPEPGDPTRLRVAEPSAGKGALAHSILATLPEWFELASVNAV